MGGDEIARPGAESRGDRVGVRGDAHPPAHRFVRGRREPFRLSTGADELECLGHADIAGVGLSDALSPLDGVRDELVASVEVAVEEREHRSPRERVVGVARPQRPVV